VKYPCDMLKYSAPKAIQSKSSC